MPIHFNEKEITIDFEYSVEPDETGKANSVPLYQIRYHFTGGMGPTVSFSPSNSEITSFDDAGHSYLSFPANMLVEVVDFLEMKGMIKRKTSLSKTVIPQKSSRGIAPPVISGGPVILGENQDVIITDVPEIDTNDTGLDTDNTMSGNPFQSFSGVPSASASTLHPEEIAKMVQERQEAADRASKSGDVKKVKKKDE